MRASSETAVTCRCLWESPHLPAELRRPTWSFNQFQTRKLVYEGKKSAVFYVQDVQSKKPLVLKLYRKSLLSPYSRSLVEREIRIHVALKHGNIIQMYSAFEDQRFVYIVLEHAAQGDLLQYRMLKGGSIPEQEAGRILATLCTTFTFLHNQGIIHRDLKPENILLCHEGCIKLADFGLAIDTKMDPPTTRVGTIDYLAPEVLACPGKRRPEESTHLKGLYNNKVDVYGLGVLAHELMIGTTPYGTAKDLSEARAHRQQVLKLPQWLPKDAASFITVAMIQDAERRPSVEELLDHPWIKKNICAIVSHLPKMEHSLPLHSDSDPLQILSYSPKENSPVGETLSGGYKKLQSHSLLGDLKQGLQVHCLREQEHSLFRSLLPRFLYDAVFSVSNKHKPSCSKVKESMHPYEFDEHLAWIKSVTRAHNSPISFRSMLTESQSHSARSGFHS